MERKVTCQKVVNWGEAPITKSFQKAAPLRCQSDGEQVKEQVLLQEANPLCFPRPHFRRAACLTEVPACSHRITANYSTN